VTNDGYGKREDVMKDRPADGKAEKTRRKSGKLADLGRV